MGWADGPGQAQAIVDACVASGNYLGAPNCPQVVIVELGGNDVCRGKSNPVFDSNATTQSYIDQTIAKLGQLPAGTEVWVNLVPVIENLRTGIAGKRNWIFKTCQDMWNLDRSKISLSAKVCDVWLVCDVLDTVKEWLTESDWFIATLNYMLRAVFDIDLVSENVSPCWTQLNSQNTSYRATGISKNTFINTYLVQKICSAGAALDTDGLANGVDADANCRDYGTKYGNVRFYLARNVRNAQYNDKLVSTLDCFHPSRSGQEALASTFYHDLCTGGTQPPDCSGPAPTTARNLTYIWQPNKGRYENRFTFDTTCTPSRVCMYLRRYNAIGTSQSVNVETICTEQFADHHDVQFTVTTPGYYWVAWEITDLDARRYPTAGYPPEVYGGTYYYLY